MKKLISLAACIMAVVMVAVSCTPKDKPDGKCELTAFSLSSSIAGAIDAAAKTITVVVPTSVTSNSFTPTFKVTDYDLVTIGGTAATSGETSVVIEEGTKVVVADDVSAMRIEYTIKVVSNDEKAELVAVSFKAADNDLLEEDVTPDAIASEMVVRVPGEAFRKELTVTVEAGFNDVIKVNNETVASGSSIKVDTNFPIDITVTDSVDGATSKYVLKVGKILQYVVTELGTYTEGMGLIDFTMTINPKDNLPYFAYTRKLEGESNNGVSLVKWNGSSFELVGTTGIADASARSASKPQVAFANDGTTYVKYLGGEVASKPTIKKLGSEWTVVGEAGCGMENNNNTSNSYPFFIHPANNVPSFFWAGNTKNKADHRTMCYAYLNGESWTSGIANGTFPALGSDRSFGNFFRASYTEAGGKVYVVSQFNQCGYYVHEVGADGTLTTIVENYVPEGAPHGIYYNLDIKADPSGNLFSLATVRVGDGSMQLFSVDKEANTFKAYGPGLPVTISASGGVEQSFAFAINPVDGLIVMAFVEMDGSTSIKYLDDNMQWAPFVTGLPSGKIPYFADFDANGNGYISYVVEGALKLFRVGLEADILPE